MLAAARAQGIELVGSEIAAQRPDVEDVVGAPPRYPGLGGDLLDVGIDSVLVPESWMFEATPSWAGVGGAYMSLRLKAFTYLHYWIFRTIHSDAYETR
jgi:hypothetical protein